MISTVWKYVNAPAERTKTTAGLLDCCRGSKIKDGDRVIIDVTTSGKSIEDVPDHPGMWANGDQRSDGIL